MSLLFFEQVLLEEGEEDAPADDVAAEGSDPPDMGEDVESDFGGDSGDFGGGDDFGSDFGDDSGGDSSGEEGDDKEPSFGEKISNVLNSKLYQRYLSLLNRVENEILSIKNNLDVFNIICQKSAESVEVLKKLSENIRIYLNEFFLKENYSKNLLFFNKCINLYKLTNDRIVKLMKNVKDDE